MPAIRSKAASFKRAVEDVRKTLKKVQRVSDENSGYRPLAKKILMFEILAEVDLLASRIDVKVDGINDVLISLEDSIYDDPDYF